MPALSRAGPAMSLKEIVERLPSAYVLVIGDPMTDVYRFGHVDRICPEGPVPVFVQDGPDKTRPGGAANVGANVTALRACAYSCFPPSWSVKVRFMVGSHLLLRQDFDKTYPASLDDAKGAIAYIASVAPIAGGHLAVVLSDYGRGWVNPLMSDLVIDYCQRKKIPVLVDPALGAQWSKYVGCSIVCPNEKEALDAPYLDPIKFPRVLFKKGARGMILSEQGAEHVISAKARHVYDVTGAGDTVIATMAAAVAAGATYLEAAELAALAAGHVVGEVGTAVCPLEKLKELVDAQN